MSRPSLSSILSFLQTPLGWMIVGLIGGILFSVYFSRQISCIVEYRLTEAIVTLVAFLFLGGGFLAWVGRKLREGTETVPHLNVAVARFGPMGSMLSAGFFIPVLLVLAGNIISLSPPTHQVCFGSTDETLAVVGITTPDVSTSVPTTTPLKTAVSTPTLPSATDAPTEPATTPVTTAPTIIPTTTTPTATATTEPSAPPAETATATPTSTVTAVPAKTASAGENQVYELEVNSYIASNDICVAAGDTVSVRATGEISVGPFVDFMVGKVGAGGTTFVSDSFNIVSHIPHAALLCRVQGETDWRQCGSTSTFTTPITGCLEFEINDNEQQNNNPNDFFTVEVTIISTPE